MDTPKTLLDAARYFADPTISNDYMRSIKWPDGKVKCTKCGGESVSEIAKRPGMHTCNKAACRKQFSVKVGTIFEDSPLGLDKWFVAVWSVANCKNGISSHELGRAIGVTQKTAWFMLHRIRKAMENDNFDKLDGIVESDETYVGGKAKNMHKHNREQLIDGRGAVNKTAVQGIMKRGGDVRTFVVGDTEGPTLRGNVLRNVDRAATVCTDSATAYIDLNRAVRHLVVDHSHEFVRGEAHTNSVENFWTLLKRALMGTYVKVAPFHLHRYASEQGFRFNMRKLTDSIRFDLLMRRMLGKRLQWRELCAVGDAGFMGIK